ncbi:type II secretion system F domain-containing protein [Halovivax asiaticus JCM 14624]|uniref:Type II secretion system F domain-containing protein n=1 Tax=Halovivax asiaticus JCM 14624 TaxID=1227490 RepID=M0BP87_9EURY|nr:type II secretion system F family protein [Halovivax asiaticus]ELZ12696.1 type II secretion system F domain-containing protein [Halovivax asiaticus JCM 14624]
MNPGALLPLAVAVLCTLPFALAQVIPSVDRVLTRLSIHAFGDYVDEFRSEHPQRQAALRAAHAPASYREYGARSFVYALLGGFVGSVTGVYLIWAVLTGLSIDAATLRSSLPDLLAPLSAIAAVGNATPATLLGLLLVSGLTLGVVFGGITYWLRWWYPGYVASRRARAIEASLPSTVAFCYALSRSGMEFTEAIRIVARNGDAYGQAAAEFDVAVTNMDAFGMDVTAALQLMGRRTASDQFREFTENLVSVLQSGHSLSEFLERQYHDYQEEAESQQESILNMLATLAEAYVTVLVAGPLFLITILVVIGFSVGDTVDSLRAVIYVILPFGNLAFVVYLSTVTDSINPGRSNQPSEGALGPGSRATLPDGGSVVTGASALGDGHVDPVDGSLSPTRHRLAIYERLRWVRGVLASPFRTLLDRPDRLLWVTLPLAAVIVLLLIPRALEAGITAIEDALVVLALVVMGSYAVVYERHRYRISAIERAVPDLLDRLSSVNEAGMSVIASVDRVRQSDLGVLDDELDRVWADVRWGADLQTSLWRFEHRVRTRAVSRMVTLLTEAMNASGDLATVLRIASRQASADLRLDRERKQVMTEYMVVVYVSFLVFIFIIAVLSAYLLPSLPTESVTEATGQQLDGPIAALGTTDTDVYMTLFYHATVIQGATSGFVAGQLASGDLRSGAKHATLMTFIAFVLFTLVL